MAQREAIRRRAHIRRLLAENARRFNELRRGRTLTVVVDGARGDALVARSYAEAPDVDPVISLPRGAAEIGAFAEVRITGIKGLDLVGEVRGTSP